jgi:hypothetical protein
MFVTSSSLKVVATILAKDEEDIISTNIEHHIEQGISQFIITDNNSSDKTRQIAEKYPEVVEIIDEPDDTHNQSKWVTRMARLACKLKPDWIVHLDADELWGGLPNLRTAVRPVVGCEKMFLHPPMGDLFLGIEHMRHYLDFSPCGIPDECKIAHRPDPEINITHGNHGVTGSEPEFTNKIWRHHYPIRSKRQFDKKALGHLALKKRGSICKRWERWYEAREGGRLDHIYSDLVTAWLKMISCPNHESLGILLQHWATPDSIAKLATGPLPTIGQWPSNPTLV